MITEAVWEYFGMISWKLVTVDLSGMAIISERYLPLAEISASSPMTFCTLCFLYTLLEVEAFKKIDRWKKYFSVQMMSTAIRAPYPLL